MTALVQRCDEALFRFVNQACANPLADAAFPLLNHAAPFLLPALALAAWLAWRNSPRAWKWALAIALGLALGDALVFNPLKKAFARPRPAATLAGVRALAPGAAGGWSLPSSHTANAFLAAAMFAAALPRRRALGYSLAGAVALARVYVGVHWPLDVAASALLGWGVGKGFVLAGRCSLATWRRSLPMPFGARRASHKESPAVLDVGGASRAERAGPQPWTRRHGTLLLLLALAAIQGARLLWAATTDLDVPASAARLWGMAACGEAGLPARAWFRAFGDSPLSLWALPWAFQTLWLAALAWLARVRGGRRELAALVLLATTVPLVSQLSFAGSPELAFADADWAASDCARALAFYLVLGLPLWVAAVTGFRRHPAFSGLALAGLLLGASFPHLPWTVVALLSSGVMLHLAARLGSRLGRLGQPESRRARVALTLLLGYGLFASAGVYNPRLLRKADLSLLPRNSPHYGQTGFREYCARIRPHRAARFHSVLWADTAASAWMLRYYLREPGYQSIRAWHRLPARGDLRGDLWVRQVDFAQVNPRVLFIPRNADAARLFAARLRPLDSVEIFRRGDPVRQFQLFEFTGEPGR
jgi:undecaprenyl-diphosphatase